MRNDAAALARSAELRREIEATAQRLADLDIAHRQAHHFAEGERRARALAAHHERWRALLALLDTRAKAAADLDRLVLDLAAAVRVVDKLGDRALDATIALLGPPAAAFAPDHVHEEVTALLVKYGAVERHLLPARYVGEIALVRPVAHGAALLAARLRGRAPADVVEETPA